MTGENEAVAVTFHPQSWVDLHGQSHDWDRRQLVPAEDRDSVTFTVPLADATDDDGTVFADESYRANLLRDHPAAPSWVTDWDGPYYVTTERQHTDT